MKTSKDYYSKPNQNIKYVNKEDDLKTIIVELNLIIKKLNKLIK